MEKGRLEAFTDGVMAIIITIMVLELKAVHGDELQNLMPLAPIFLSYILSFIYVGIYWNNHHHLLYATSNINGRILWANLHLLFWLSLIPFVTGWMGENHFATMPVALYGIVLFMSGLAYYILARCLITAHSTESILVQAIGKGSKEIISMVTYAAAIPLAYFSPWLSLTLYIAVAVLWFIPDKRIEKHIK
jgi:uncharacterized membrane protein